MLVSIVIPCYYSEKTIRRVVEMVMEEFDKNEGYECEFVLVNDGSKDGTYAQICGLGRQYPNVCGVNLMRNFGQHNALMAALQYTKGELVLGMDDDMQTHPSQIFKLVHKIEEGYDVVYGVYPVRKNSALKNLTSKINEVSSRIMLNRPKDIVSSNFWIITRAVRDEVIKYESYNPYIDGIFYRVTHNIGNVPVEHHKREVGTSGYTFRKLFNLWLAYWNFSVIPLRVSFFLGIFSAMAGVIISILVVLNKILYPDIPVGWSSTLCTMVFLFGLVLMVLGIVGEYLGKIIMILNNTPQYIVRETVNAGDGTLHGMVREVMRAEAACAKEQTGGAPDGAQPDHARDGAGAQPAQESTGL
ncbi:MAG: glycosyltransferase family 2 protein [Lachnospiraceae bacterium]|uniref:glycosyltransferase family 2 protein n=1 Tax=Parablautia sp. Marseille-Q6255 TaxID=3039593 RepID=UPI0024BC4504|nr:glycosyltransferase family 2 protein [Parablautia sp. Marseille-Q6255]